MPLCLYMYDYEPGTSYQGAGIWMGIIAVGIIIYLLLMPTNPPSTISDTERRYQQDAMNELQLKATLEHYKKEDPETYRYLMSGGK